MANLGSSSRVYTVRETSGPIPTVKLGSGLDYSDKTCMSPMVKDSGKRSFDDRPRRGSHRVSSKRGLYPVVEEESSSDSDSGPSTAARMFNSLKDGIVHEMDAERDSGCKCPCSFFVRLEVLVGIVVALFVLGFLVVAVVMWILPLFGERIFTETARREYNCTSGTVEAHLGFALRGSLAEFKVFESVECKAYVFSNTAGLPEPAFQKTVFKGLRIPEPEAVVLHNRGTYSWHAVVFMADFKVGTHEYACVGSITYKKKVEEHRPTLVDFKTEQKGATSLSFSSECRTIHLLTSAYREAGFEVFDVPSNLKFDTIEFMKCDVTL